MRLFAMHHDAHAYTSCFYAEVSRLSVEVLPLDFSGSVLMRTVRKGDWLHFHWPSWLYYDAGRSTARNWAELFRVMAILLLLRARGARIAWTAHNLYPHDEGGYRIHRVGRRLMARMSHLILAHGPSAATILQEELGIPATKLVTGLVGNWIKYFPNSMSKQEARRRLDLTEDDFVLLFIGLVRPYKNIEMLIRSFCAVAAAHWRLVIAGAFLPPRYQAKICALGESDQRIAIHPGYVPDDQLEVFLNAADRVVLPYVDILTSGAATLAISFGRPVIAPDRGSLRDHIPPTAGWLYDPALPDGLARALRTAPGQRYNEADILAHASTMTWDSLAATFVDRLRA